MKMMDRLGWKVYLVVMSLILLAILGSDLTAKNAPSFINYADYLITAGALVGVFGYAFRIPLLHQNFWRALLVIVPMMDLWITLDFYWDSNQDEIWILYIVLVIMLLLLVPEYIALYFYGYRSRSIWERSDN